MLDRPRDQVHGLVFAVSRVRQWLPSPGPANDRQIRLEAATLFPNWDAERGEERRLKAPTEPQDHAPIGEPVEQRDVLCDLDRIADRDQVGRRPEAQAGRARGGGRQAQQRRWPA